MGHKKILKALLQIPLSDSFLNTLESFKIISDSNRGQKGIQQLLKWFLYLIKQFSVLLYMP